MSTTRIPPFPSTLGYVCACSSPDCERNGCQRARQDREQKYAPSLLRYPKTFNDPLGQGPDRNVEQWPNLTKGGGPTFHERKAERVRDGQTVEAVPLTEVRVREIVRDEVSRIFSSVVVPAPVIAPVVKGLRP